ncbi:PLDc N-terminal domain-containing protein [Arthrobacter sp. Br18]|uniref:PLDc N-terminal domain-containing protein n=1 Tax=Arthrobacter sp. Br18 TaxID=1312954 RepID=UPI00047EB510|nr:PLDc N-terminal domain-containing protein [Arthrobacter sp. Br18]
MPRLLLFLAILGVAVIIYALIDCIMSKRHEVRSISKPAWLIIIILLPLIGTAMWFLFGRPRSAPPGPGRPARRHPTAPDDDPQFLQNLETKRRQQAREAERRRKEQELKAREAKKNKGAEDGDKGSGPAAPGNAAGPVQGQTNDDDAGPPNTDAGRPQGP